MPEIKVEEGAMSWVRSTLSKGIIVPPRIVRQIVTIEGKLHVKFTRFSDAFDPPIPADEIITNPMEACQIVLAALDEQEEELKRRRAAAPTMLLAIN